MPKAAVVYICHLYLSYLPPKNSMHCPDISHSSPQHQLDPQFDPQRNILAYLCQPACHKAQPARLTFPQDIHPYGD
jgi:hypothetical protein